MQDAQTLSATYKTAIQVPVGQKTEAMLSQLAGYSRKRGFVPIPIDFFAEVLPRLSEAELRVYLYQLYRTLGFGKQTDSIANRQFVEGIRSKQGDIIDHGCGLKTAKSVRRASRQLAQKGLVNRSRRRSKQSGDQPCEYTINLDVVNIKQPDVPERETMGEGIQVPPQNASTKRKIQRCKTQPKTTWQKRREKSGQKSSRRYMDSDHVDYLIDQIEQTTGDTHSRGAFADIAMRVGEGRLMELLAILKDRGNIGNKGAWFLTSARRYAKSSPCTSGNIRHRLMKADGVTENTTLDAQTETANRLIPQDISLKALQWKQKRELAVKLGFRYDVPVRYNVPEGQQQGGRHPNRENIAQLAPT